MRVLWEDTEKETFPSGITVNTLWSIIKCPLGLSISNRNKPLIRASTVNTMNCNLPKITYSTLRILLLLKIREAISRWGDVPVINDAFGNTKGSLKAININLFTAKDLLRRVPDATSIAMYSSSIALKFSAASQQPVLEIVRHLAELFCDAQPVDQDAGATFSFSAFREITVIYNDRGILQFKFSDRAIAAWLKFFFDTNINNPQGRQLHEIGFIKYSQSYRSGRETERGVTPPRGEIWDCQRVHARCCSLLRLGAKMLTSAEIAWLTEEGKFRLVQPAERDLLFQIIAVMDELEETPEKLWKSLMGLSRAFERYDRACQILPQTQGTNLQLAQCRLGLVILTQWLLKQLLEQRFGLTAPAEL